MISTGGTGGHIFPAVALMNAAKRRNIITSWIGRDHPLDRSILPKEHHQSAAFLPIQPLPKSVTTIIPWFWQLLKNLLKIRKEIKVHRPDLMLCMGGYVSFPLGIASILFRIPLVLFEANTCLGQANKILKPFSSLLLYGLPPLAQQYPVDLVTGNPIHIYPPKSPKLFPKHYSQKNPLNILIMGGSQGAVQINNFIQESLQNLDAKTKSFLNIIHQTGQKDFQRMHENYPDGFANLQLQAFIEDMQVCYQKADLVICRAGALTISELYCLGLPTIVFPYPNSKGNHQKHNASILIKRKQALMGDSIQPKTFTKFIKDCLNDGNLLIPMYQHTNQEKSKPEEMILAACQKLTIEYARNSATRKKETKQI
jgi:UDP-N-acetylglucosamine--N-acetylmuramyl-(pentapeptide) pyrophosphoryl-undecaprenol N-acetylglucosamine transferase